MAMAEGAARGGALVISGYCSAETMDQDLKQKRANIKLALLLAAVAAGVLAAFFWTVISTGGAE